MSLNAYLGVMPHPAHRLHPVVGPGGQVVEWDFFTF